VVAAMPHLGSQPPLEADFAKARAVLLSHVSPSPRPAEVWVAPAVVEVEDAWSAEWLP